MGLSSTLPQYSRCYLELIRYASHMIYLDVPHSARTRYFKRRSSGMQSAARERIPRYWNRGIAEKMVLIGGSISFRTLFRIPPSAKCCLSRLFCRDNRDVRINNAWDLQMRDVRPLPRFSGRLITAGQTRRRLVLLCHALLVWPCRYW